MNTVNYKALSRIANIICILAIAIVLATQIRIIVIESVNNKILPAETQVQNIVVHSGDTIWSIAMKNTLPGQDVRNVVIAIRSANNIAAAGVIIPGQVLRVPVTETINDSRIAQSKSIR